MASRNDGSSLDEVKHLIRTHAVIDNHAHNLLRAHQLKSNDFLTITTEAAGPALEDTPKSLSHIRAARQLKKLYELPAEASWEDVLKKRQELLDQDTESLTRRCLEGTASILIDDGINTDDEVYPYIWHSRFTTHPCKRIVRIETIAAKILTSLHQQGQLPIGIALADEEACAEAWVTFVTAFEEAIAHAVNHPEVAGFKSVICYRTGLDVRVGRDIDVSEDGLRSFRRHYLVDCVSKNFRVDTKGMCDALVISTCKLISAGVRQSGHAKPLQFHTGLGDNDISLLDSNPACLQPLIKAFSTVPIVLLHSSYPYTREAGYLATVYKNVYLDIGEVFPMVSRDGQEHIFRQALELIPYSKILWSTDGHHHPETYWLANVQGREIMETVILEYIEAEDLTIEQAKQAVRDIIFNNSNKLYNLELEGEVEKIQRLTIEGSKDSTAATDPKDVIADEVKGSGLAATSASSKSSPYDPVVLADFCKAHDSVEFVFIEWLDYMATLRTRITPIAEFRRLVDVGGRIGVTNGNLGTLQNDGLTPVCNPVGQIYAEPDLRSLRPAVPRTPQALSDSATVIASYCNEHGDPLEVCPRSSLDKLVQKFASKKVDFLVGFEIEVMFLKRPSGAQDSFEPWTKNHAWATMTDEQYKTALPLLLEITSALKDIDIPIQQIHSESGAGQYEFVLPPLPLVEAVDTLVQARQCIQQLAALHGMRATLHPRPLPGKASAAHAHISLNSTALSKSELESIEKAFMASVLEHLPAICAFAMPEEVSYTRVGDDMWTGGSWVCWGTQNRETPLRRVGGGRWEVRCLDGMANMYLALGAILGAGSLGMEAGRDMSIKDCSSNPSKLTADQRQDLGITTKLPTSISQALEALENDERLQMALSPGLAKHFIAMKKAEQDMLSDMPEAERTVWLIERY